MKNRITIEGLDGAFGAYIARPKTLPAPAVVVLHEVFGVNTDIRKTCDELAEQGFLAVAPDLFWRQEPGVDLSVTSEPDWQHGLRLYQAYDRDAVAKLSGCTGTVAVLGYCLGGLMTFLTALRYGVDAAVVYHGGDTEKYLGEINGFDSPLLMHLAEEDEFISKPAQAEIKAALASKPNATVYSYPGQHHAFARHNGAHYDAAAAAPVPVIEETPLYWSVVFDYPPFNIVDASIFEALQDLLARMNASPSLRVVVFESANPEFYLAHFDLTGKIGNIMTTVGASGLPILMDTFVRLTKSPVVSIAKIRGCVRGVSSEFVLACDMRFASRENTLLGQPEVGVGLHPGGGGTERLPHLVGRGRALEIVLGANDFDGDTAERYGYVNRALPDVELDGFVDALARRIASFDRRAITAAKNLVNQVSLPSAGRLLDALSSFQIALTWGEAQQRVGALLTRGLQRDPDFERNWPEVLGALRDKI